MQASIRIFNRVIHLVVVVVVVVVIPLKDLILEMVVFILVATVAVAVANKSIQKNCLMHFLVEVLGVDVDRHASPKLPWVEIVQVHGAHGSPSAFEKGVDHPPDLARLKQVLAAFDKGGHRGPTDGRERGAHPPVLARVFPRHQQVHVGGFHGPQSMQFRCQHRAKIAVPWRVCPSEVARLC